MALPPGTRIGPYEVLAPLGVVGLGEVYRVYDSRVRRSVAMKMLPRDWAEHADRLKRFEQDAQAATALNHPNILAVQDSGLHEGTPYIVSELLEGETLRTRLARGAPAVETAIDLARQLAEALAAAHGRGLAHLDVRPDTLFLNKRGQVKVLDFGGARAREGREDDSSPAAAAYRAPEQLEGGAADARADVFALGAVMYELFSGRRAFAGDSPSQVHASVRSATPPPLALPEDAPGAILQRLIDGCLVKDRADRTQTSRDVAIALDEIQEAAEAEERRARLRRLLIGAAAALLVLIAAGIGAYCANGL
jgi:serine/threonine protein kinase